MKNPFFESAKKISDYFGMVTRIGVGFAVAYILWNVEGVVASGSIRNRLIAIFIAVITTYFCFVFSMAIFWDSAEKFKTKTSNDISFGGTVFFLFVTFSMMYASTLTARVFIK